MRRPILAVLAVLAVLPLASVSACKTASSAADGVKSAGSSLAQGAANVTTSLVNVDLSNVLNDLALDLKIDKANIPINAQIPITIAANVCGVNINILSVGAGGGSSQGCTATTSSRSLAKQCSSSWRPVEASGEARRRDPAQRSLPLRQRRPPLRNPRPRRRCSNRRRSHKSHRVDP